MVVRLANSIAESWCEVREFLFCFAFLASTPGLHRKKCKACQKERKKCKACQDDNHLNSKECKRCGGALGGVLPVRAMECQLFI